jgi:hypothetical protein
MRDTENENRPAAAGDLFARLRKLEGANVPARVHDLAVSYGSAFTNACIQPHELLTENPFEALPQNRQEHVRSCFLCALVVGDQSSINLLAHEHFSEAAAAATRAADLRKTSVLRVARRRPFYRTAWSWITEAARSATRAVAGFVPSFPRVARTFANLRALFRSKPHPAADSPVADSSEIV